MTQKGAARRTARGINTINTRRCVELFVTLGLRPRKANASAKHVKDYRWERKPRNTRNTRKGRLRRRTACDFTAKYRGASQARAVHAARAYMNRGLRSFHSLTPGCELSPFQGWGAAPRRGEEGAGRPTNDGDTPHMRPDEGRKYPDPGPLLHSSTAPPGALVSTRKSIRRRRCAQDKVASPQWPVRSRSSLLVAGGQ